jgi:membrane peptidoglycan carboxypeptidase
VGFSVLAGVLVTAMVTPAIAVTSATAQGSIDVFENLPDTIKIGEPSQQNQILGYRGGVPTLIATVYQQNRIVVNDQNVSPLLKQAAVDGEDRRFYQHGGVDVPSIARALVRNSTQSSAGQSGSSTLDMQLVKNILVQNAFTTLTGKAQTAAIAAANGNTIDRKLKEMKLAIGLDKKYTKNQILLGYLNIVGMGGQTYGVESAAMEYFGVHAKDVTLPEAASLVAIVQQPVTQNLSDPKYYAANKVRRDEILAGMLSAKNITQKQYTDALATPIASYVHLTPANNGCRTAPDAALAGFACD